MISWHILHLHCKFNLRSKFVNMGDQSFLLSAMPQTDNSETLPQLPLSRERVLRVALHLADRSGIEQLSMRKLAQELGVKAMSLYNHVIHKEDLLDGMVDLVVGEIEVPDPLLDWQLAMRRRALSAHQVLLQHPWAAMAMLSRINVGPAMLRYVDATIGCLHQAGFSLEMADHACNAIDNHIYGFTLQELNFPIAATEYAKVSREFITHIPATQYPYMNQLARKVIEGHYDGLHNFEFGLEFILNGLEQLRKQQL
jgi:AcrR family transcriptional regulator